MIAKGKFADLISQMSPEAQQKAREGAAAQLSAEEPTWARTARLLREEAAVARKWQQDRRDKGYHTSAADYGTIAATYTHAAEIVEREGRAG